MTQIDIVLAVILDFFLWLAIIWGTFSLISVIVFIGSEDKEHLGTAFVSLILCVAIILAITSNT